MPSSLRVIVTGLMAQHPLLGGLSWHYLQYVLGLARMGHDVYYIEDSGEFPYRIDGGASGTDWIATDCGRNVSHLAEVMSRVGLADRWAYRFPLKSQWFGIADARRHEIVKSADLLINVSGSLEHPEHYRAARRLLYIDTDPVVTQIKIALGEASFPSRAAAHDVHFSYGECPSGAVTETRYRWRPTRQPIVLSEWRPTSPRRECFTTIMNWASYAPLDYHGRTYGQKDVEFMRFLDLPGRVAPTAMEVAISRTQYLEWPDGESPGHEVAKGPHDLATDAGWHVVDAIEVCRDLDGYRRYIESSKAEWSVAKNAYVVGSPGWFSERSACYLAAGRPVVVQDTGFGGALPTGEGILPFRTVPEAVAAVREVESDYARHASAARAIAEAYFDSDMVLTRLIDEAMSADTLQAGSTQPSLRSQGGTTARAAVQSMGSSRSAERVVGRGTVEILRTDLLRHPAVKAWREVWPRPSRPQKIEVLKDKQKGSVYRIHGVGPAGSAIIAKRSRREKALIQRAVYDEVLSNLPLETLRYFGSVAERDSRFWWLFFEDVGDRQYCPQVEEQRASATRWLAELHVAAESMRGRIRLPDLGPQHYRAYVRTVLDAVPSIRAMTWLKATDQVVLRNIASMCSLLEAQWDRIEAFCEQVPRTLVHGDCLPHNVHFRVSNRRLAPAFLDWENAGWGLPGTDIGLLALPYWSIPHSEPDCVTYASVVRERWPGLTVQIVKQLASLGQMFWALKVTTLGAPEIGPKSARAEKVMNDFGVYESVLATAIRSVPWEG